MSQRIENEPCFVLHRRDFRNTSLILEVFSVNHGRVAMVAKGARRPKSRTNALLQVFQPLLISWTGKGDLHTLTQVEAAEYVKPLAGGSYASAYYLTELIFRLLKHADVHEELFTLYAKALTALRESETNSQPIEVGLRLFEKQLLQELGYGLVLDHDVNTGESIDPDYYYHYVFEHGPVICTENSVPNGPKLSGRSIIALNNETLDDTDCLHDCKRLMRSVLQGYIGDKPLQSRLLYNHRSMS